MSALLLRFVLVLVCWRSVSSQLQGLDLTLALEAAGTNVVVASIQRIQESGIFPSDNRLLRRIAYVETRDGVDITTYSDPNYHGGIWQVDEDNYDATRDAEASPDLLVLYPKILDSFGIDWPTSTWSDLRRPFFSALAARIYLYIIDMSEPIPPIGNLQAQGEYWRRYYVDEDAVDTAQEFIDGVNEFEFEECPSRGLDLAFVLDSSGSVGINNFDLTKDFVANVISVFTISPLDTQVAAIAYSGFANISFRLNTFSNRASLEQGIRDIGYFDIPGNGRPSTNTAAALTALRTQVLTTEAGARPPIQSIPRVAVVVTDGQSNVDSDQTIPSAQALHDAGIITFAVGVGGRVNMDELNAIASQPNYVSRLSDFNIIEFEGLQRFISDEACNIPTEVDIEQIVIDTLDVGEFSFLEAALPTMGMTIRLEMLSGRAALYASTEIRNPNAAFYDLKLETDSTADIYFDPSSFDAGTGRFRKEDTLSNITIHVSIEGLENVNIFIFNTTFGDTSTLPSGATSSHHTFGLAVVLLAAMMLITVSIT